MKDIIPSNDENLIAELVSLIESTKDQVISYTNSSLSILFWQIGAKVLAETLRNERAEYGKQIVVTLSRQLVKQFGRNYEEKNLRRMIQFSKEFPNFENVVTLSRKLSWSHFLCLIPLKSKSSKEYYSNISFQNSYSVRELSNQISRKAFARAEQANIQLKPKNDYKGIFKDPYLLDFCRFKRRVFRKRS